jgi:hypothetical protein
MAQHRDTILIEQKFVPSEYAKTAIAFGFRAASKFSRNHAAVFGDTPSRHRPQLGNRTAPDHLTPKP